MAKWKPGEAIPSEIQLAARFRVSQGTVRKAIDELAAENLVTRRQGKGTFVATHAERQVQYRFLKLLPGRRRRQRGRPGPSAPFWNAAGCAPAPTWHRAAWALRAGDSVIQIKRILSFVGVPTILEDIWLPGQAFKGLTAEQLGALPGAHLCHVRGGLSACASCVPRKKSAPVLPDETQAQWLNVPAGTPLLSVERLALTRTTMCPWELRRGLYRTDTHHYHNKLN